MNRSSASMPGELTVGERALTGDAALRWYFTGAAVAAVAALTGVALSCCFGEP